MYKFTHSFLLLMRQLAQKICDMMPDYHSFTGFKFTPDVVTDWVSQFNAEDQEFILSEFSHLLSQGIYLSESDVRQILIRKVNKMAEVFSGNNPIVFLQNVTFLNMQGDDNSQSVLLRVLDEELNSVYGMSLAECGSLSKRYVVYLDDILATGGTIYQDLKTWLQIKNDNNRTNFDKVISDEHVLIISVLCKHTWGAENLKWRLKFEFNSDQLRNKIRIGQAYIVENHPTTPDQKFNCAYPCKENQPASVLDYQTQLEATRDGQYAFRNINRPENEGFFSSSANRIRFENILLHKGIELLQNAASLKPNQRPLGMTNPTKKTFGTGTLFFTWRNVSNTSPIVFWWHAAGWMPLFELTNRGI